LVALAVHSLARGSLARTANALQQISILGERVSTGDVAKDLGSDYGWSTSQQARLKTLLARHAAEILNLTNSIEQLAIEAFGAVVVTPILAIFFLSSGGAVASRMIQLISTESNYESLRSLAAELHTMLQHYIRATVILGALSLGYAFGALLILGFPHAIALGVLAGILEFIPMAGWITAAAAILTVGVLTQAHWIWMAALLGIWRLLMDYCITPRVLRHELEIPPLLAIFTLMVGAAVGGVSGVYLSIPIVAATRVVWRRLGGPQARVAATS
jgi:predicted PurR-regulated permease PerM